MVRRVKTEPVPQSEWPPFVAPAPILEGSEEERFHKQRSRFLGIPYDRDSANVMRGWAAYKRWAHGLWRKVPHKP